MCKSGLGERFPVRTDGQGRRQRAWAMFARPAASSHPIVPSEELIANNYNRTMTFLLYTIYTLLPPSPSPHPLYRDVDLARAMETRPMTIDWRGHGLDRQHGGPYLPCPPGLRGSKHSFGRHVLLLAWLAGYRVSVSASVPVPRPTAVCLAAIHESGDHETVERRIHRVIHYSHSRNVRAVAQRDRAETTWPITCPRSETSRGIYSVYEVTGAERRYSRQTRRG